MSLYQVGRLCMKIAGRDAGKTCVVVENDGEFVVVDGSTRRRKVNVRHLEPLADVLSISSGASHDVVGKEFEKLGLPVWNKKSKSPAARVKKQKATKEKKVKVVAKKEEKLVVEKKVDSQKKEEVSSKVEEKKEEPKSADTPVASETKQE